MGFTKYKDENGNLVSIVSNPSISSDTGNQLTRDSNGKLKVPYNALTLEEISAGATPTTEYATAKDVSGLNNSINNLVTKSGTGAMTLLSAYATDLTVRFATPFEDDNYVISIITDTYHSSYYTNKTKNGFNARIYFEDGSATSSITYHCDWVARKALNN